MKNLKWKRNKKKVRKNKMTNPVIDYYYNIYKMNDNALPLEQRSIKAYICYWLNIDAEDLGGYTLPSDLTTNEAIYNELCSLVMAKYQDHANIRIRKSFYEGEPTNTEKEAEVIKWGYKFINLLNDTHNYYVKMLLLYKDNESKLMDNIKATSKNKVKFNDTPQNSGSGTYEGDNYITHFTSTEGENSSELNSKIMRLKEIQDNYRDMMSSWVRDFERIFYTEEVL